MKLKGKCLQEFDEWKKYRWLDSGVIQVSPVLPIGFDVSEHFYSLPESMQIGVLEDYFDSVGIEFYIKPMTTSLLGSTHVIKFNDYRYFYEKSKPEARSAAIEKACEIRNEQLK